MRLASLNTLINKAISRVFSMTFRDQQSDNRAESGAIPPLMQAMHGYRP